MSREEIDMGPKKTVEEKEKKKKKNRLTSPGST